MEVPLGVGLGRGVRLLGRVAGIDRDKFGTAGPELAADRAATISAAEQIIQAETDRAKAAQDAQIATNAKLDTSNALANEGNGILSEILTTLRGVSAPQSGANGASRLTTARLVNA